MNKIEANHIGEINLVSLLLRQLAGKFCDAGQFWYVYPILAWQHGSYGSGPTNPTTNHESK